MMFWYDHGVSGWGWVAMTIGMVAFWGLLITLAVLAARALAADRPTAAPAAGVAPTPEQLLAERFARGEIDEDEYLRRLGTLRDTHSGGSGHGPQAHAGRRPRCLGLGCDGGRRGVRLGRHHPHPAPANATTMAGPTAPGPTDGWGPGMWSGMMAPGMVNPSDGAVQIEYGPAMMWNTAYGMHFGSQDQARVSADQAREIADRWLRDHGNTHTAGDPEPYPGYYTLHTLQGGSITGMLSVNATTGQVWEHTWHGTYIATSPH
ncbi:hypothetical protein [Embleya sp. NBC_00896]|uniref:SHOCT domain-containing protein n=1 Tax=Embleya sp. NBC_00896 TaxID=2975961 RepID=UPI002F908817